MACVKRLKPLIEVLGTPSLPFLVTHNSKQFGFSNIRKCPIAFVGECCPWDFPQIEVLFSIYTSGLVAK